MLEFNKTYTWEEIVKNYPDLYVFITNVKEQDGEIKTCKLLNVCNKENKSIFVKKYRDSGISFECCRTTVNLPDLGVLI